MANRRRGKSVVLDSLPSLVTTEGGDSSLGRKKFGNLQINSGTLREIVIVLVGLILVVWLFFGDGGQSSVPKAEVGWIGSRPVQLTDSRYIIPAHFGGVSRDGVKKAPGDKQKSGVVETKTSKKQSGAVYQFSGARSPEMVVVTVIDDNKHPRDYIEKIIENRLEYAQTHNYGLLVKHASDFSKYIEESYNHQSTWARVALAQEAQLSFPDAKWIWYLSEQSLIMEPQVDLLHSLLPNEKLSKEMQRDVPILRFENTHIRTYQNSRVEDISMVFTRNSHGVSTDSFIFRNNLYSRIWLETWSDPLYRTFNRFQNEEQALGHLILWHPQFLVRSSIINPKWLSTIYNKDTSFDEIWNEVGYVKDDFVVALSCDFAAESCKREFQMLWNARTRLAHPQKESEHMPHGQNAVQNEVQVQAQVKAQEKAEEAAAANNVEA